MRSALSIFCLLLAIVRCDSTPQTTDASASIQIDSTAELLDSTAVDTFTQIPQNRLFNLREILRTELKRKGSRKDTSLVFTDKATIEHIDFVASAFTAMKIDSIGIYGSFDIRKKINHLPMETLSVLYYRDQEAALEDFVTFQEEWFQHFDVVELMFKPGGMVFVIDNKVSLLSINTCHWGYEKLLKVDSLVSESCFNKEAFTRLHFRCGAPQLNLITN